MKNKDKQLLEFLKKHPTAALATISKNNTAQCATVFYFADNMLNFYFVTKTNSRKHGNLQVNKQVALCITDEQKLQTVQIEGRALVIKDKVELDAAIDELKLIQYGGHRYENPPINKLYGDFIFYKVIPTWIRWTDYKNKWTDTSIYERSDFSYLPSDSYLHR